MKLGKIIETIPQVDKFIASKLVAPISASIVMIDGQEYELRYFTFYMPESIEKIFFGNFIKKEGLMEQESQITDIGFIKTEVFLQSDNLKEKGIFYTLSIRKLD